MTGDTSASVVFNGPTEIQLLTQILNELKQIKALLGSPIPGLPQPVYPRPTYPPYGPVIWGQVIGDGSGQHLQNDQN